MKFDLWAIDSSPLDPFQFRIFCHIARVGICFQSVQTIAEQCHISVGKVSIVRRWLEKNGYIEKAVEPNSGRVGWQIVPFWDSLHEQTQQNNSPHEQNVHSVNGIVHHMNENVHSVNLSNTTIRQTAEDNNNNSDGDVFRAYENEIGLLTPVISDSIGRWIDEVNPQWIIDAIGIASRNNKRNWKYAEAILKRWQVDGKQSFQKPAIQNITVPATPPPNGHAPDDSFELLLAKME